jgi:hypothetical protein
MEGSQPASAVQDAPLFVNEMQCLPGPAPLVQSNFPVPALGRRFETPWGVGAERSKTFEAPSTTGPGGTVMAFPPPMSRQARPRSESFVVQAVSEKIAPPKGADGPGLNPAPPQKLVPGMFVVTRWAKPAVVVVVVLVVVVVVAPVVGWWSPLIQDGGRRLGHQGESRRRTAGGASSHGPSGSIIPAGFALRPARVAPSVLSALPLGLALRPHFLATFASGCRQCRPSMAFHSIVAVDKETVDLAFSRLMKVHSWSYR